MDLAILQAPPQPQAQPKAEMTDDVGGQDQLAVQAALEQHPTILQHVGRITEVEDKLKGYRRKIRSESDPVIRRARSDLQSAKDRLKRAYEQRRQRPDDPAHERVSPARRRAPRRPPGPREERNLLEKTDRDA